MPTGSLTDQALIFAWRLSDLHRGHIHTTLEHLQLAQQRAALLNEAEHRCPDRFAEWMAAGAFDDLTAVLKPRGEAWPKHDD